MGMVPRFQVEAMSRGGSFLFGWGRGSLCVVGVKALSIGMPSSSWRVEKGVNGLLNLLFGRFVVRLRLLLKIRGKSRSGSEVGSLK